jgi:hypothetical protein
MHCVEQLKKQTQIDKQLSRKGKFVKEVKRPKTDLEAKTDAYIQTTSDIQLHTLGGGNIRYQRGLDSSAVAVMAIRCCAPAYSCNPFRNQFTIHAFAWQRQFENL